MEACEIAPLQYYIVFLFFFTDAPSPCEYYLGKAYDVFNLRLIKVLFSFLRFYCSIFSCLSHIVAGCVILCIIESNIYMCQFKRQNFKFNQIGSYFKFLYFNGKMFKVNCQRYHVFIVFDQQICYMSIRGHMLMGRGAMLRVCGYS